MFNFPFGSVARQWRPVLSCEPEPLTVASFCATWKSIVQGRRAAVSVLRALSRTPALKPYAERHDLAPDADDARIADWVRANPVSMYHPVGTARMGAADERGAVLDPKLRVRGVQGLRVADASAMPGTIRGHTMAPVTYVAERAAALIGGQSN